MKTIDALTIIALGGGLALSAFAQQAPNIDQIDAALSMARASVSNELAVKEQRILARDQRITALEADLKKAQEAACKPEAEKK